MSLALTILLGNWLAFKVSDFNALTENQNKRLSFQKVSDDSSFKRDGLNQTEINLAQSVIERDKATLRPTLLFMGNSQTMAIMDQQSGDLTTPQWLQILLSRNAKNTSPSTFFHVRLGSLPNITPTESLIQLVAAHQHNPSQADILVLCSVLEEMRNVGVRDEVEKLARQENTRTELAALVAKNADLSLVKRPLSPYITASSHPEASEKVTSQSSQGKANPPTDSSPQNPDFTSPIEEKLQTSIEAIPLFAQRGNLYGRAYSEFYVFRNRLAGITSSSPRPVPPGDYQTNLQTVELTLRYAKANHLPMIVYLAPIRPIQPNPNVAADVALFRHDLPALCHRYGAVCLDYTDTIPEKLWTNYPDENGQGGQRDFAHFTGAAHKMLAQRLIVDVGSHLGQLTPHTVTTISNQKGK